MRITGRLGIPYDAIIDPDLVIGTEVGGLPRSRVIELKRLPVAGEQDAATIVIDVPEDVASEFRLDAISP